jgi:hypothetical protein
MAAQCNIPPPPPHRMSARKQHVQVVDCEPVVTLALHLDHTLRARHSTGQNKTAAAQRSLDFKTRLLQLLPCTSCSLHY